MVSVMLAKSVIFQLTYRHTEGAVAAFFTPTSQKPKDPVVWSERAPGDDTKARATLLVAKYQPGDGEQPAKRRKVAAFDLVCCNPSSQCSSSKNGQDSTLITSASGKKHSQDPTDWKWWDSTVPTRLRKLYHEEG